LPFGRLDLQPVRGVGVQTPRHRSVPPGFVVPDRCWDLPSQG
jgi:hypothetical protein